jgi:hypothetical protein
MFQPIEKLLNIEQYFMEKLLKSKLEIISKVGHVFYIVEKLLIHHRCNIQLFSNENHAKFIYLSINIFYTQMLYTFDKLINVITNEI